MNWISKFLKPGWESRDAATRANAVAGSSEPALLSRLAEFARNDPAPEVRRAAVRRLSDLSLLGDRSRHDGDAEVRRVAGARLRETLVHASEAVGLEMRERYVAVEEEVELLTLVAAEAPEASLRRIALGRITRAGFLADRCLADPDPELRMALLDRLEIAALERVAERARKSDKRLSRAARERADELKRAAGDAGALAQRAQAIGDLLDQLRRERPADLASRAAELVGEWAALRPRVAEALALRVDGYARALHDAMHPRLAAESTTTAESPPEAGPAVQEARIEDAATVTMAAPTADGEATVTLPAPPSGEAGDTVAMAAPSRTESEAQAAPVAGEASADGQSGVGQAVDAPPAAATTVPRENPAAAATRARQDDARALFDTALLDWEAAIAEQRLQPAKVARARLEQAREGLGRGMDRARGARYQDLVAAHDKLSQWQRWANNKARARLCDEIEALIGSGMHPDGVANKIKDARVEWDRLELSEREPGAAGNAKPSGLDQRFRALCHRALAPAKGYFSKRDELRAKHAAEVEGLLAADDAASGPGALVARRRALGEAMRGLDEVDPRARGALGKRLRAAMAAIDERLGEQRGQAEAEKAKLLANLKRGLAQASLPDAIALCQDAQARFQRLARGSRERDAALAQALRELVDPWFERAKSEQSALAQAETARIQEATSVLADLATLAASDDETLRQAESRLLPLAERWRALAPPEPEPEAESARGGDARGRRDDNRGGRDARPRRPRRVEHPREREYDRAVASVHAARAAAEQRQRAARRGLLFDLVECCDAIEQARVRGEGVDAVLRERGERCLAAAHPSSDLRARWAAAIADGAAFDADDVAEATRSAAQLVVRAELLAGIDSPESERALRREIQMRRLAERLSGAPLAQADELDGLIEDWSVIGPVAAGAHPGHGARLRAALAAVAGKSGPPGA